MIVLLFSIRVTLAKRLYLSELQASHRQNRRCHANLVGWLHGFSELAFAKDRATLETKATTLHSTELGWE